jgi:hypothetical protein
VLMTFEEINLANVVRPLWALLAGVTVLLFIACTNVGNLLLVRGTTRLPELAIRAAIGASRARIVRQGITRASCSRRLAAPPASRSGRSACAPVWPWCRQTSRGSIRYGLDRTVLAFTVSIVIVTGVLFGLASTQVGGRWRPGGPVSVTIRGNRRHRVRPSSEEWMIGFRSRAGDAPARRGRAAGVGVP